MTRFEEDFWYDIAWFGPGFRGSTVFFAVAYASLVAAELGAFIVARAGSLDGCYSDIPGLFSGSASVATPIGASRMISYSGVAKTLPSDWRTTYSREEGASAAPAPSS